MGSELRGSGWFAALALLGAPVMLAQRYTPPPPPLTVDPCAARTSGPPVAMPADPKAKPVVCPPLSAAPAQSGAPSTAEQFPYPGEAGMSAKPAAESFPFPGDPAPKPAAAAKPAGSGSSAADQFPYPGETSKSPDAVPEGNTPRYVPDSSAPARGSSPDSGSSSSSSSSSGDPSATGDSPDRADDAAARPKGRRPLPKVSAVSPDERVSEDLDVAKFYTDRGNFQAAYLRTKDATKVMPDDAESHFALARAAEKLRKKDEAAAEYALYLKLDPAGDKTAAARKALAQLR